MTQESRPYDFQNPEDLFHCIDILTKARVALSNEDAGLALELAMITETLMNLSQTAATVGTRTAVIVDVLTGDIITAKQAS